MKYVYILIDEKENIKIGITNNMTKRISQIRNGNPEKIEIYHCEKRENALDIERELKKRLKKYHKNGEYYCGINPIDVRKILLSI